MLCVRKYVLMSPLWLQMTSCFLLSRRFCGSEEAEKKMFTHPDEETDEHRHPRSAMLHRLDRVHDGVVPIDGHRRQRHARSVQGHLKRAASDKHLEFCRQVKVIEM